MTVIDAHAYVGESLFGHDQSLVSGPVWRNLTHVFPHPYTPEAATEWIESHRKFWTGSFDKLNFNSCIR